MGEMVGDAGRVDQSPNDVSGLDNLDPGCIFAEKPEVGTLGFVRVNGRNTMKALSIRQPWAWEIGQGIKVVEFRSWSTNYRGRFLVHTSKTINKEKLAEERKWLAKYDKDLPDDLDRGGFVGIATLADCVERTEPSLWRQVYDDLFGNRPPPGTAPRPDSEWFGDSYGFFLTDAQPIQFEPYPGKLRFFNVPDDRYGSELEI